MQSKIEKNLTVLREHHPALYEKVEGADDPASLQVVEARGGPVPCLIDAEKKIFIHSRYDPVKEAERFIGEIETGSFDLFILFGFGFAYHLESLMERIGGDAICLVMEKSAAMVRRALECRDLAHVLSDPRLIILVDPDEDEIAESLKGKSSRTVSFITHRGSFQTDPGYYRNSLELARSFLSTKNVNIATLAKFEKIWGSNIARNIASIAHCPGVNLFYGKFTGIPAIVVSAGPSLLLSLDFIRKNLDRALVIAVDTSYRILRRHGIVPHFCVTVDPQLLNARYFEGSEQGDTVLVADPVAHPSVFRLFRGRAVVTGLAFRLMKWIERICGEKGEITHGGSVSTNAYDFAKRLGASPVVLVGQDLSFTGGYAHARGSYLDAEVHLRTGRFYREEMFNRFQLTALPKIMVRGTRAERVHTNQKMMIFLSWFEKRKDPDLINATCEGAYMPGVAHRRAEELQFPERGSSIWDLIGGILSAAGRGDIAGIKAGLASRLAEMTRDVDSLIPVLEKAVGHSDSLAALVMQKDRDGGKLNYLLKKLDDADRTVESMTSIKEIISFSMQRVIHTITEGYDIEEGDQGLPHEELVAKRSQYLYRGLLEGARFNRKIFGVMAKIVGSL